MSNKTWLTRKEACRVLGNISGRTLRRKVDAGLVEREWEGPGTSARYHIVDKEAATVSKPMTVSSMVPIPLSPSEKGNKTKAYMADIKEYLHALNNMLASKPKGKRIPPTGNGSSLCILLSDTHVGKKTRHFNIPTALACILDVGDKVHNMELPADLSEIVLLLGGDMIEGEDIYGVQAHHIEGPAIEQVHQAVKAIGMLANDLAAIGLPVRIKTVPGNHGRVSKTADPKTNWDNVLYYMLELLFAENNNIDVEVNTENFTTFKVQDKKGLMYHHGTKHTGTAAMQSKLVGWMQTKGWDFLCHGHWHKWEVGTMYGKPIIKNGSMVGYDDLAERMGVYDPPRQAWFLVRNGKPLDTFGFFEFEHVSDEVLRNER